MYFNTRTGVEPPESLLRMTPMGGWVYEAHNAVAEAARETPKVGQHQTAVQVLLFFKDLNRIFIQDAAATLVEDPTRRMHPMYHDIAALASPEFEVSAKILLSFVFEFELH